MWKVLFWNYPIQVIHKSKPFLNNKITVMRNTNSQKVKLGIFVVIGTFLLVGALYFIGNRQNLFGNTIQLYGEFNNVNGLQLGNNVRYSGIDVGTISSITMINDTVILVEMTIKESVRVHIKKDACHK